MFRARALRWRFHAGGSLIESPVVWRGVVSIDGINAGIAKIFTLGSIVGGPAIADGVLYVSSTDGTLYAIA